MKIVDECKKMLIDDCRRYLVDVAYIGKDFTLLRELREVPLRLTSLKQSR